MMPRCRFLGVMCAIFTLGAQLPAQPYAFTTIAGTSGQGYADGSGSNVRFGTLQDVAVDAAGNVYVSDYQNRVVRKVSPEGAVTTLAGLVGFGGATDGTGSEARFGFLFGIAVDAGGNVYVADPANATIRRITPAGVVTTFAGSPGAAGHVDGTGTSARFFGPRGVAVDSAGNVYVADTNNYTVRKITAAGVVTTLAGSPGQTGTADGVGSAARFVYPYGIGVDGSGNVYVADTDSFTIRKITPDGTVTTLAGAAGVTGSVNGTGSAARFGHIGFIDVDSAGNIYAPDWTNHTLRRISPAGVVTTLAGSSRGFVDGTGGVARFSRPIGTGVDAAGNVYVADAYNFAVRKVTPTGAVTTVAGRSGRGAADGSGAAAQLDMPRGLAFDSEGNLLVADSYNHTIRRITPTGVVSTVAGAARQTGTADGIGSNARFTFPYGVAADPQGNIYVADTSNHTVRKITPSGLVGTLAGLARTPGAVDGAGNAARFTFPIDIEVDAAGNLYVADNGNHAIRKITPDGVVTTLAGQLGAAGSADGSGASARFSGPWGIASDGAGGFVVTDNGNETIRKIAPDGRVSTLAGLAGASGSADGTGSTARFFGLSGVAVDERGNIFVTDTANYAVRQITPAGVVTTLGGGAALGYADGLSFSARLLLPEGIAVDRAGNLHIADTYNHTIRKAGDTNVAVPASRLFNLSVRANLVAGRALTAGFVIRGTAKSVLVRSVGPGLTAFLPGIAVAGNPRLDIYDNALNIVQANEDWGGTAALTAAFASVGAFSLLPTSQDAAILRSITGAHTAQMQVTSDGVGLIEAYDSGTGTASRLINVAARYDVTPGAGALVAGFVIDGTAPKTLLIRGVGPTLASVFGLPGALTDPKVEVFNGAQQKVAENDNWSVSLLSTFAQVGAFGLAANSKDAALLVSLAPGLYTAQLTGSGVGGEGVIEIYEVGN